MGLGSKVEFVGANNVERLIMTGKLFQPTNERNKEFEGFNFDSLREIVLAEDKKEKETLNWVQVFHWQKEGQTQIYGMDQNQSFNFVCNVRNFNAYFQKLAESQDVIFNEATSLYNCDLEAFEKGITKNSDVPKQLNWIEDDKNIF